MCIRIIYTYVYIYICIIWIVFTHTYKYTYIYIYTYTYTYTYVYVYYYIYIYVFMQLYVWCLCVCVSMSITLFFASISTCTSLDCDDAISGIQGQWQDAVEDLLLNRRRPGDVWWFEWSTTTKRSFSVTSHAFTCRIIFLPANAQALRSGWHRRAHHTAMRWSSSIHCPRGAQWEGAPATSNSQTGNTFCLKFHTSQHT